MASTRWDSYVYSAAVVIPRLPAFLALPFIASALSLADMGKLASSWIFIELFQTLAGLGLKASLGRFFPAATTSTRRREILTVILCGNLVGGIVFGLAAWSAFSWSLAREQILFLGSIESKAFFALLAASLVGNFVSTFVIYFRADQRAGAFLTTSIVGAVTELAFLVVIFSSGSVSFLNLLLIESLKQVAMLAFIIFMIRKDFGFAFSAETLKTMVRFGIWFVPLGIGEWLVLSSDRFWLGQQADLGNVGVYGFIYKLAMPLGIIFTGGVMDLHARLFKMEAKQGLAYSKSRLDAYIFRAGIMMFAYSLIIPMALHILTVARPEFPRAYLEGISSFPVIAAVLYCYSWGRYFGLVLEMRFLTGALMSSTILAGIGSLFLIPVSITICLNFELDVLVGAAVGALAAQFISLAFLAHRAELGGWQAQFLKGAGFIVAAFATAYLLGLIY